MARSRAAGLLRLGVLAGALVLVCLLRGGSPAGFAAPPHALGAPAGLTATDAVAAARPVAAAPGAGAGAGLATGGGALLGAGALAVLASALARRGARAARAAGPPPYVPDAATEAAAEAQAKLAAVKVGDAFPAGVSLDKGFPPEKVPVAEFCKGKKVVLVGLPGAFTPTWSSTQVPGYLSGQEQLKAKGVTDVLVFCVNDGAVMTAWGADQGIAGSMITFLGDPRSEVTEALGLVLDHPGPVSVLGSPRCKRFSMLLDDGVIKSFNIAANDEDPAGDDNPTISLVSKMLEDLEKL